MHLTNKIKLMKSIYTTDKFVCATGVYQLACADREKILLLESAQTSYRFSPQGDNVFLNLPIRGCAGRVKILTKRFSVMSMAKKNSH